MPDRTVQVRYSKDGGRNWSGWRNRSLGEVGEFVKRTKLLALGHGEQWVFEWRATSPVRADLIAASLKVEPCE